MCKKQRIFGKVLRLGLLLALIAGLVSFLSEAAGPVMAGKATAPEIPANWWTRVQEEIRTSEYYVTWQEQTYLADVPSAYQAPNRVQNLRTYFTVEGPIVIPRVWSGETEPPPWRWEISLTAWGRSEVLQPVSPATIQTQNNLIEYQRGPIVEWYRNDETGLKQDFTLLAPPPEGRSQGLLQIDLLLGGDLTPRLVNAGSEIEFRTPAGLPVLRYDSLLTTDVTGRTLPSRLALSDSTLSLLIDDTAAVYPIQVDPTVAGVAPGPAWLVNSGQEYAVFGYSVATAGDANGDGYSDVMVGAPYYDNGQRDEGRAYTYYGSASGLSTSPGWTTEGNQASAKFGYSVATAGDVNGDGYSDVLVGAPDYDNGQEDEGAAWVYHGSASGLNTVPANFDEGNQADARFGFVVAPAGDVNGDGYADIIVGAPDYDNGENAEGRVWVWHGSSAGVSAFHNWRAESNQELGNLGISAATAGDVNGDGYADIIVGASNYTNGQSEEGVALVWHGSASGVNNDLNGDPSNAAWLAESNQAGAGFGRSVSTAGDVNGDGYADIIVGAPYYDNGQIGEGGAWVYHGSASGLSTTSANQDEGNQADAEFGYSVATAGDVNGDGYADIIVGAPSYTNGQVREGRAWVWHGSPTGVSSSHTWRYESEQGDGRLGASVAPAGDVNGDGYADIIVGSFGFTNPVTEEGAAFVFHGSASGLSETAGWTKLSNKEDARFGWAVGTAGDVNGDGYADVIVGAPRWDGGQNEEGGVWVYHGAATGLTSAPAWHRQSNTTGAKFGYAVATAGDVNGDGYTDVIVGAPEWTNGQTDEGGVFVFHGSDSGLHSVMIDWYNEIDQAEAGFGHAVGTAGDVNGDGYADVIVGAPYWNHGQEDEGGAWVYHGSATGLTTDPAWSKESNQTNAAYGYAVGTAGDVNRDGYTDVIVGAPYWTDGHIFEGATWVYLGSSSGLNAIPNWYEQSEQTGSNLGYAVGTAGDVNGDGFADVIVGVPYWSNGQLQEGRALVYYGSSAGVRFSPWQKESDLTNARFGYSVGTAGDVNGDGYADVVVGAPYWTNGENYEGGAWVYHGAASGPHSVPDWHAVGGQEMAHYGWSVGTAGDVNSDGYAEVIVGAPDYNGTHVNEGQALVYFGNGGPGVSFRLRQRSGDNSLLAHLGKSNTPNSFRVNMRIASPFGRGKVRAEVEVKPLNTVFNGVNTHLGYSFTAGPGIDTVIPLSGLSGCMYHWRARWRYDPAVTPFQSYSRWVTIPWNGWNEQDLRTDCAGGVFLPLILRDSDGG